MKTAFLVCLMLSLTEMAVAQEPDTTPVKQPSFKQKPPKNIWYVNAPNLSYGNFYLMAGLGFVVMNKHQWGMAFEI